MNKKLISSILVVALLNLAGCYSVDYLTVPQYELIERKDGKPEEIKVTTKDYEEYQFSNSNFYIENDTLYGKETFYSGEKGQPFEGEFDFKEIEHIQLLGPDRNFSFVSIEEYLQIELKRGKPDYIYLISSSNRYHFMKNDYYIENNIFYGKGKLLTAGKKESTVKKIAVADIVTIEVETFELANTCLLSGGIFFGITALIGLIALAAAASEH
jgi:hypothetical protein